MAIYNSPKFGPVELSVDSIESFENDSYNGVRILWSADRIGFGSCDVVFSDKNGDTMYADTEYMCTNENKDFLRALFSDLADQLRVL